MSSKNLKLPKIDKRQLYFDRNRKTFIDFDLERTKTCLEIKEELQEEIDKKLSEIYNDKYKEMNFSFIMMNSKSKFDNSSLIEIKLDLTTPLSDIMTNKQYFLCYLPKNCINIEQKRKMRNKFEEHNNNDRFKDVERGSTSTHQIEKYLNNEGIYYFDKEKVEFIYGKGYVNENKITINYKKTSIEIIISELKKENYYENEIPPSIQVFKIKCPNYILEIHQNNITHFLGLYKQKSYLLWRNCINSAKIKNNNTTIDSSFNTNISNYNYLLFVKKHSVPSKCYIINQLLENPEKRQIFLDGYNDKKISDLASSIYSYKINIKNNKFLEAWMCLKQISFYVNFNNIEDEVQKNREREKYSKIFTQERIDFYNNVVKKVNESISKIKSCKEDMNNVLKNIFKIDLFDNLYYNIYEFYLYPYFQKIKNLLNTEYDYDQKPDIIQKFHLLLSKYYINYFNMKNIDNFNCLCINVDNEDENYNGNLISYNSNNSLNNDNSNNSNDNNIKDNDNSIKDNANNIKNNDNSNNSNDNKIKDNVNSIKDNNNSNNDNNKNIKNNNINENNIQKTPPTDEKDSDKKPEDNINAS